MLPVLHHAGLRPSDLITLSDLSPGHENVQDNLRPETTSLLLVDHNAPTSVFREHYSNMVIGCIDHHAEESFMHQNCGDEPGIVRKAGSCSSLIIEYCKVAWDELSKQAGDDTEGHAKEVECRDREIAMLALAPILTDSGNLTVESRTEQVDVEAVEYLENKITGAGYKDFDREAYFKEIKASMEDLDALSMDDVLRKDYKYWKEADISLGISAVVQPLQFLIDKAGSHHAFGNSLKVYTKQRQLSLYAVMTLVRTDSETKRELLIWGTDKQGISALESFESKFANDLGLQLWGDGAFDTDGSGERRRCWHQGKVEASRKQVAPFLRDACKESLRPSL